MLKQLDSLLKCR
jgi:hypothetical protein